MQYNISDRLCSDVLPLLFQKWLAQIDTLLLCPARQEAWLCFQLVLNFFNQKQGFCFYKILLTKKECILSVVYFHSEKPPLSKIYYSICGLFLQQETAALQRSVARDFGGVSRIRLFFLCFCFFFCKTLGSNIMVYTKKYLIAQLLL